MAATEALRADWSDWQWKPVRGRRTKRRPHRERLIEDEDDEELPMEQTESGPGRPEPEEAPAPKVQPASSSALWRAQVFFKSPPEWKVIVENTFISIQSWRDRSSRTSMSAPARLVTGCTVCCKAGESLPPLERHRSESTPEPQLRGKVDSAEAGAGAPSRVSSRLPADFPAAPTTKPPAPPLAASAMVTAAEAAAGILRAETLSANYAEVLDVHTADEAASPKKKKNNSKPESHSEHTREDTRKKHHTSSPFEHRFCPKVFPSAAAPAAVSTPPVAQPRPAPVMEDFGMMTVVKKRRGRRSQVARHIDIDIGASVEADDEDSSIGQPSTSTGHAKTDDDEATAADDTQHPCDDRVCRLASSRSEPPESQEEAIDIAVEDDDEDVGKASPTQTPTSSGIVPPPLPSPSGKSSRKARKRAAKAAAAKASLTSGSEVVGKSAGSDGGSVRHKESLESMPHKQRRPSSRDGLAVQRGSGRDLAIQLRGFPRCSWPSCRPSWASHRGIRGRGLSSQVEDTYCDHTASCSSDELLEVEPDVSINDGYAERCPGREKAAREAIADRLRLERIQTGTAHIMRAPEDLVPLAPQAVQREEERERLRGSSVTMPSITTQTLATRISPANGAIMPSAALQADCGDVAALIAEALVREKAFSKMATGVAMA